MIRFSVLRSDVQIWVQSGLASAECSVYLRAARHTRSLSSYLPPGEYICKKLQGGESVVTHFQYIKLLSSSASVRLSARLPHWGWGGWGKWVWRGGDGVNFNECRSCSMLLFNHFSGQCSNWFNCMCPFLSRGSRMCRFPVEFGWIVLWNIVYHPFLSHNISTYMWLRRDGLSIYNYWFTISIWNMVDYREVILPYRSTVNVYFVK